MKKYTIFMLSIGIFLCQTSTSFADQGDIPSPKDSLPFIMNLVKSGAVQAITFIVQRGLVSTYDASKKNGESWWSYYFTPAPKLKVVTHEQLELRPDLTVNTLSSFPETIQRILKNENTSNTGEHKPIILYGVPGTGKTTLAQQIALQTGGNYYHVHQELLDGHSDAIVAKFLRSYVNQISDETKDGVISTLHLEEFGKQLGKSMESESHNHEHGRFENTWKRLLQDLESQYPKVRVVACSNFGQNEQEVFNNAITGERAHVIKINAPNEVARKSYFTTTCVAHLEKEGLKNATTITKSAKNQIERNKKLTDNYLVSAAMHKNAQQKHEDAIKNSSMPFSINTLMWPPSWVEAWHKNKAASQMKAHGYVTPAVTWDLTTATPKQAEEFANSTKNCRYRQLDAITESARRDKLEQISRMKERSENPGSAYIIDKEARTYSLPIDQSNQDNHEWATAPFGQVQPHNLLQAAAQHRTHDLHALKNQLPDKVQKINEELSHIPIHDIKQLADKYKQKCHNDRLKLVAKNLTDNDLNNKLK